MTASEFRSELRARLERNADRVLLRIILSGKNPVELTGGDIVREGERLAQLSGAPAGSVVLLLLPHSVELFLLHIGLILTERIPAILPWPTNRVDPEKYQGNLLHQFRNLPAEELITIPELTANLGSALPYRVVGCATQRVGNWNEGFSIALPLSEDPAARSSGGAFQDPGEALFLQFSGGTTGSQKAVVITAPILTRQLERLREALLFSSEDVVVSWLPLYHDMGLIGCLWLPLWHSAASVQFAASEWLLNPGVLFDYLERFKGTFCWLPNFAFSYLAGQRKRMDGPHSLAHVRAFVNCSEPVRLRSIRDFAEAFVDWGVSMRQVQASYAMAENVFAVTQTQLGKDPSTFARAGLAHGRNHTALAFDLVDEVYVSSGAPIPGMRVRIVNPDGAICAEREAGEIQLSTESLFSGYWGAEGFVTSTFGNDGWYSTGDYGFMASGELYVIGRLKDIVIVGGQNIFPEDVENVVNAVPGIYPGRVVAFGIVNAHETEGLIVVAEMKGPHDRERALALEKKIKGLVLAAIGVSPARVHVVPERWIVKSTAGKISRRETRERYLREQRELSQTSVVAVESRR
jgi:acyl-CoA synthetase (AMP-forming)/AMP-acid ligase II